MTVINILLAVKTVNTQIEENYIFESRSKQEKYVIPFNHRKNHSFLVHDRDIQQKIFILMATNSLLAVKIDNCKLMFES